MPQVHFYDDASAIISHPKLDVKRCLAHDELESKRLDAETRRKSLSSRCLLYYYLISPEGVDNQISVILSGSTQMCHCSTWLQLMMLFKGDFTFLTDTEYKSISQINFHNKTMVRGIRNCKYSHFHPNSIYWTKIRVSFSTTL